MRCPLVCLPPTASVTDTLTRCAEALHNLSTLSQLDGQWHTLYGVTAIVLCLSAHFCTAVFQLGTAVLCVSSHRLKSSSYGVAASVTIVTGVLEVVTTCRETQQICVFARDAWRRRRWCWSGLRRKFAAQEAMSSCCEYSDSLCSCIACFPLCLTPVPSLGNRGEGQWRALAAEAAHRCLWCHTI